MCIGLALPRSYLCIVSTKKTIISLFLPDMSRRPRNPYLHPPDIQRAVYRTARLPQVRKLRLYSLADIRRLIHQFEHRCLHPHLDALIRRLVGSIQLPIDPEFTPFILTVHRGVDHERCT